VVPFCIVELRERPIGSRFMGDATLTIALAVLSILVPVLAEVIILLSLSGSP